MSFHGQFETHLTLATQDEESIARLAQWSQTRGLKFVHILLSRGQTASQPMLTTHGVGTLESERGRAEELRRACEDKGFPVVRVKLEVLPRHPDVPRKASDARNGARYFEHHIKLLLPPGADLDALAGAVSEHGAHLSRNARCVRADGYEERFVSGRCYGVGAREAGAAFTALLQTLGGFPFPVLETEEEFVVFDSNLALDAGWLDGDTSHGQRSS